MVRVLGWDVLSNSLRLIGRDRRTKAKSKEEIFFLDGV